MIDKPKNKIIIIELLLIIIILCVVSILIMMNWAGKSITIEQKYDIIKLRNVLDIMNSKLDYDKPPVIDYTDYGQPNDETQNCKDRSFTFAVLYGYPAEVVGSPGHAFIKIGKYIIEPQQSSRNFRIDYRMKDISYEQIEVIKILPKHKKEIRRYFKE